MTSSVVDGNVSISTNILVLSNVIYPVLDKLAQSNYKDVQTELRSSFFQLEETFPGFSAYFLQLFIEREMFQLKSANTTLNELVLKLEKYLDKTPYLISSNRSENELVEMNCRLMRLKQLLSEIPDVIFARREFLETIKEIASAIKKSLDCVPTLVKYFSTSASQTALGNRKREFVRASKNFSNTLKSYFRDNNREDVFLAANNLLIEIDYLLRVIKLYLDPMKPDDYLYPLFSPREDEIVQKNSNQ